MKRAPDSVGMSVALFASRGPKLGEPKATFSLVLVALVAAACHTTHASRATCTRVNVAWVDRSGEASKVCGATWQGDHVARHGRVERHDRASMSPEAIVRSDMHDVAVVAAMLCRATFSTDHVASLDSEERHRRASMSLHSGQRSDIHDCALRARILDDRDRLSLDEVRAG